MRRRHKQGVLSAHGMRSMWEFVFVSQFLRVFQGKFGFVSFTAEELENAFLDSESLTLFGIFTELLRILLPKRDVKTTTWQEVFKEELQNRSSERSPFDEGKSYDAFRPEERILLLKQLIDYLAEGEDKELKEFVKDFLNPNSSRVKPVGRDASNNIYWYFNDLRLYREVLGKKGRRTGWETVCINCTDWENLLSTFQKSSNSNEKKLYKYLKNELYPSVMPTVKENEKEKKLETVTKESPLKAHHKVASKRKTDKNAVLKKEEEKEETKIAATEDKKSAPSEQDEEDTTEEDQEQEEEISDADEDFDPEDEEDSPPQRKKRKLPAAALQPGQQQQQQQQPRRRGRPPASKGAVTDSQKVVEKIERRRKKSEQEQEQLEKDIQERKELEQRVDEEMQKQESIISVVGGESRAKRRCVIRREQMSKKKEWWEEEELGFESDEDNERDIDSDNSDGPRRRKKLKFPKPAEMPEPPNRIYVFSTGLANRAAEAVQIGRVESITSFHRAQPSSSPFLKVEQTNVFGKQKPFYPQQYSMRSSVGRMGGQMASFSAGMTGGMQSNAVRPGYGTSQWDQMQAQQSMYKDRQRQTQSQAMEDIHQLLFGNPHCSNSQATSGVNGMYSRSGYNQQGGVGVEQSGSFTGYPRSGAPQQSAPYMERRTSDMRGQTTQQSHFPAFSQQASQQQQGYFHRPRHLGGHPAQGNSNSPSSDPLGAGVRSPPPPYPGARPPDSRHTKNSPVPSPTNTGSPHTPQTPLTPQTPRFPGPSPSEPSKPTFSPSHPQGSMGGPSMANYPVQGAQAGQPGLKAEERPINSQPRPGFIDLSSKTLSHGIQNPYSSVMGNYNQAHSPLDRRPEENKSPAFGTHNNHESPLHSPTDRSPASHFAAACGPPNKSPFMRPPGGQPNLNNSTVFATTGSTIQVPKSFSVESLTAPSQPHLDRSSIPPSQLSKQPMPQYSSLYFPSNKYPPVFGQPQYQYPGHMQHPGAFYNSQLTPNMYLGRASLPVYPPTRDAGL